MPSGSGLISPTPSVSDEEKLNDHREDENCNEPSLTRSVSKTFPLISVLKRSFVQNVKVDEYWRTRLTSLHASSINIYYRKLMKYFRSFPLIHFGFGFYFYALSFPFLPLWAGPHMSHLDYMLYITYVMYPHFITRFDIIVRDDYSFTLASYQCPIIGCAHVHSWDWSVEKKKKTTKQIK